jgi:hypothetical protein
MSLEMLFQQVAHYRDADELLGLCQSLSVEQGRALALYTLDKLKQNKIDQATFFQVIERLVAYVPDAVRFVEPDIAPYLVPAWHDIVYLVASPETRDRLLPQNDMQAYYALAWIGDETAQRKLLECEITEKYTLDAGWVFDAHNQRRDLFFHTAYELFETDDPSPVSIMSPHEDHCRNCHEPLVALLDLDLRDRRLVFLGLDGDRLRIAFCPWCSPYTLIYTQVDVHGKSIWHSAQFTVDEPEYFVRTIPPDIPALPPKSMALAPRRTPYEVVPRPFMYSEGVSQIGGFPSWNLHGDFLRCPVCDQWMMCVGQVDVPFTAMFDSGIFYAHLCQECLIAVVNYQVV